MDRVNAMSGRLLLGLVAALMLSAEAFAQPVPAELDDSTPAPEASAVPGSDTSGNGNAVVEADYFTGAATHRIALEIPPGRSGMQPNLVLDYNSHRRELGSVVGFGWEFNPGFIERSAVHGIDYQGDDYVYAANGIRQQLVINSTIPANGCREFNAKVESPSGYVRFFKCGDHWEAYDKGGKKYTFGTSPDARLEGNGGAKHFRWYLDRAVDLNGNEVQYRYLRRLTVGDLSFTVLSSIHYTGHPQGAAPPFRIEFVYGSVGADRLLWPAKFAIVNEEQLTQVSVYDQGQLVRTYDFTYDFSPASGLVVLQSLTLTASDGTQTITLPARSFAYASITPRFALWGNSPQPVTIRGDNLDQHDDEHAIFDMNGDGYPDRIVGQPNSNAFDVFLGNGNGFQGTPVTWVDRLDADGLKGKIAGEHTLQGIKSRIIDLNGDGLPDRVYAGRSMLLRSGGTTRGFIVFMNTGRGWEWSRLIDDPACDDTTLPVCGELNDQALLLDITGDGLPDRVIIKRPAPLAAATFEVYRNRGGSFATTAEAWSDPASPLVLTQNPGLLRDMNGDGLPDRVVLSPSTGGGHAITVYPGDDRGWSAAHAYSMADPAGRSTIDDTTELIDVNRDGMADRIVGDPASGRIFISLNRGGRFETADRLEITDPVSSGLRGQVRSGELSLLIDFNGDGYLDRFVPDGNGGAELALFRAEAGQGLYLLREIDNGLGVATDIGYAPAAGFQNHLLPFPLQVVTSISRREGNESKQTDIRYAGGHFFANYFNPLGRKFDGFNYVEIRDHLGNVRQHWYHQSWDGVILGDLFVIPEHDPDSTTPIPLQRVSAQEHYHHQAPMDPWGVVALSGRLMQETLFFDPRDGSGFQKLQEVKQSWRAVDISASRKLVHLWWRDRLEYPGQINPRAIRTFWDYDSQTGNLTKSIDYGEITQGPKYTTDYEDYFTHTVAGIGDIVTSRAGKVTAKEETANGDEVRNRTRREFDAQGNLRRLYRLLIDPTGQRELLAQYTPDAFGNIVDVTDPLGRTTSFIYEQTYNTYPRFERITVAGNLFETERQHDATFGKVTTEITPDGRIRETSYDPLGRVKERKLQQAWLERFEYFDQLPRPNRQGMSLTAVKRFSYVTGDPEGATAPREITYRDGQGRVVLRSMRSERSNNQYRAVSIAYRGERQHHISYEYRPIFVAGSQFVEGSGLFTTRILDTTGRVIEDRPPVGEPTSPTGPTMIRYTYQGDPWVTVTTDPLGKIKRESRDGRGRITKVVEVAGGTEFTTRYDYDFWGHRTWIRDAAGHESRVTYDNLNRRIAEDDMNRGSWRSVYDDAGNLVQVTDARDVVTTYRNYDELNRPGLREVRGPGVATETVTYHYDAAPAGTSHRVRKGELAEIVDSHGTTQWSYDPWGGVEKVERTITGLQGSAVTQFLRERDGRITEMKYPGDRVHLAYEYDRAGQVKLVKRLGSPETIVYSIDPETGYDDYGHLIRADYGNGVIEGYAYYPGSQRLQDVRNIKGTELLRHLTYSYDAVGNATSIADNVNTAGNVNNGSLTNIAYDDLHRVTGYQYYQGASVGASSERYDYDAVGNLTTNSESFGQTSYTYTTAGHAHALSAIGSESFGYDANGNQTAGRGRRLSYNGVNELTRVDLTNGMRVEYEYGGLGERLTKRVVGVGTVPSTVTHYLGNSLEIQDGALIHNIYAGERVIATLGEGRWGQAGGPRVSSRWRQDDERLRRYFFEPTFIVFVGFLFIGPFVGTRRRRPLRIGTDLAETCPQKGAKTLPRRRHRLTGLIVVFCLLIPGNLLAYEFPSDVEDTWPRLDEYFFLYVHSDHLRSSSLFTEGRNQTTHNGIRFIKGEVVQRIEYTPFGKERYVLNPLLKQTPKYTDQVYDVEDGLYFYQSRYYDAVLGRFIQPDTWPAETSNPQTINVYAYVLNNPLKYVDPSGYVAELLDDDGYGNQVVVDLRGQFDQGEGTVTEREGRDSFSDTALDVVQVGFDVVGLIPGFGEPFDIASGLISFGRGDYLGASLSLVAAIPFVGIAGTVGKAARRGTEIVQRAMSRAELEATLKTGLLRGGREGTHYVSDTVNANVLRARQRLSLEQMPEVRVELEVPAGRFSIPTRVQPFRHPQGGTLPGGGLERSATGDIPVRVLRWWEY